MRHGYFGTLNSQKKEHGKYYIENSKSPLITESLWFSGPELYFTKEIEMIFRFHFTEVMVSISRDQLLSILKNCFPAADNIRIIHNQIEEGQRHFSSDVTRFIVEFEQDHEFDENMWQ